MKKAIVAIAAIVSLSLCGCMTMTMGRKFDPDVVKKFKEGVTTKLDVLRELGDPFMRMADQGGNEQWIYSYTESTAKIDPMSFVIPFYSRVDSDTKSISLTLTFQGKGDVLGQIIWGLPSGFQKPY